MGYDRWSAYDDAERRDEDADREADADPAEGDDALLALDEEEGGEEDEPEDAAVEEDEDLRRENLGLPGSVGQVHDDVDGLDDAAGGVDGDEEALVGFHQRVVDPQHGAEERHHVRHRLEPLS